jgi:hypothetical protein
MWSLGAPLGHELGDLGELVELREEPLPGISHTKLTPAYVAVTLTCVAGTLQYLLGYCYLFCKHHLRSVCS